MADLKNFSDDLPLFVESGLIAIKQGDEEGAKKLFSAVGAIDPQNTAQKLGFGLIALHKMDIKNAQRSFQEILNHEPTNWRAQAFLAFAFIVSTLQNGNSDEKMQALKKAAELSQEVLEKCDIPSTRQLAQSVLDWEKEMQEKVQQQKPLA